MTLTSFHDDLDMLDDGEETIDSAFDKLCFSFGDADAIVPSSDDEGQPVSYFEIQEYSKNLAYQLRWRFQPDYVLVDCQRQVAAEAVATLACIRMKVSFVAVSCLEQHRPGRLNTLVNHLRKHGRSRTDPKREPSVVTVTVCENDLDPILSVFQQANVHQILYLDNYGNLREQIPVPSKLPLDFDKESQDNLMILFTSGTTAGTPKAVIGSHKATLRRIRWFQKNFESKSRVPRKTALTFVDGISELWGSLLDESTTLISFSPSTLMAEGIAGILKSEPTQLLLLPSQIGQLLALPRSSTLQRLIVSGEQLSRVSAERFMEAYPQSQLLNFYGQTETTGDVLFAVLSDLPKSQIYHHDVVAVGRPISDTSIELTDKNEIVVKGSQLCNGYLGTPEKGFDKFHTGDIGFEKNGKYYVEGRLDDIVKINGIKTCPMEVEAAFSRFYGAENALACFVGNQSYVLCPDASVCNRFSRHNMKEKGGLPWNLIPKAVVCCKIPRNSTGAGKASRKEASGIVEEMIQNPDTEGRHGSSPKTGDRKASFQEVMCQSLNLEVDDLIHEKSFVELGGDSASAITALYLLRQNFESTVHLNALDMLTTSSLAEIERIMSGEEKPRKRARLLEYKGQQSFSPEAPTEHSQSHLSVQLGACVDAKPLVLGDSIFAACQAGVLLRISTDGQVRSHRLFAGWMVHADLVACKNNVIVCLYKRDLSAGLVVSLGAETLDEKWRTRTALPIKATPLMDEGRLLVSSGVQETTTISCLDIESGKIVDFQATLPHRSLSKPVLFDHKLYYGCSSWEGGIFRVSNDGAVKHLFEGEIGPITGRDVALLNDTLVVADSYGALHIVDLKALEVHTLPLSSFPLTTPLISVDGTIFVGSNDGRLVCVKEKQKVWDFECGSSILGKPVHTSRGEVVVVTTAGRFFKVSEAGNLLESRKLLQGEAWGDLEHMTTPEGEDLVLFGARDSRFHVVTACTT